jgi:type VI secretion system secreted protein Hcp
MFMRLCRLVREFWADGVRRPAPRSGQRPRPVCLSVESLEGRLTPAIYMNYGTIKGDAPPSKTGHWVEINSFQWGVGRGVSASDVGAFKSGKVGVSSLTIGKPSEGDKGTPLQETSTTVKIDKQYLVGKGTVRETFTEVMVESIAWSGSSGGSDRPTESLSINFTKMQITYGEGSTTDGTTTKGGEGPGPGWSVVENVSG